MDKQLFVNKFIKYAYDKSADMRIESKDSKLLDEKTLNELIDSLLLANGYKTRENLIVEFRQCKDVTKENTVRVIARIRDKRTEIKGNE